MTAQAHRPVAGTPIVAVSTRQTIGHWGSDGPAFHPDQHMRFVQYRRTPTLRDFIAADKASADLMETFSIWRTWGNPDRGHQVWLTTADDPFQLRGVKGLIPLHDSDYAKDAEAVRRVLNMRGVPLFSPDRDNLESYARYLEERARHQ